MHHTRFTISSTHRVEKAADAYAKKQVLLTYDEPAA
jgi:hypothetical protein